MFLVLGYVSLNICGIDAIHSPLDGQIGMHPSLDIKNLTKLLDILILSILAYQITKQ